VTQSPDRSEYLAIFLEEAEEQIETFDDGLLRLEKEPDNPELLQEIFRAAHSLKSSAAAMGFGAMSALCHASENLLDGFRSGEMRPDTDVIDVLLTAVDSLKSMKETICAGGSDDHDVAEVIAALEAAAAHRTPNPNTSGDERSPDSSGESTAAVPVPEDSRQVVVRLSPECQMRSVRAHMIFTALASACEVLAAHPSKEEIRAGNVGHDLVFFVAAKAEDDDLHAALDPISDVASVEVLSAVDAVTTERQLTSLARARRTDERAVDVGPSGRGQSSSELAALAKKTDQTVRVSISRLDNLMNLVGELVIDRTRVSQLATDFAAAYGGVDLVLQLKETHSHMARIVSDLQEEVMKTRMLPIAQLFRRFPRMVRDLAHKVQKEVDLILEGEDTELDRSVIEEMADPLGHLLRNAVDHGMETPDGRTRVGKPRTGRIILGARQEENHIIIEVTDDGAGMDPQMLRESAVARGILSDKAAAALSDEEAVQLIFASGLSTSRAVSDVSGRGVGMDVVKTNVSRLHGTARVQTKLGLGSTVTIRLPLTLAISQALLVTSGKAVAALPLIYVVETTRISGDQVKTIQGHCVISHRGRVLPLLDLGRALEQMGGSVTRNGGLMRIVVVKSADQEVGLIVESLVGEQEIVLKPIGDALGDVPGLSGATILGDGTVALVLDVASLMDQAWLREASVTTPQAANSNGQPATYLENGA